MDGFMERYNFEEELVDKGRVNRSFKSGLGIFHVLVEIAWQLRVENRWKQYGVKEPELDPNVRHYKK